VYAHSIHNTYIYYNVLAVSSSPSPRPADKIHRQTPTSCTDCGTSPDRPRGGLRALVYINRLFFAVVVVVVFSSLSYTIILYILAKHYGPVNSVWLPFCRVYLKQLLYAYTTTRTYEYYIRRVLRANLITRFIISRIYITRIAFYYINWSRRGARTSFPRATIYARFVCLFFLTLIFVFFFFLNTKFNVNRKNYC